MDAIISALGLILSALMGLPARTVAMTDAQKSTVAKSLASFIATLDNIINQGYEILSKLEVLPTLDNRADFLEMTKQLNDLTEKQIEDLSSIARWIRGPVGPNDIIRPVSREVTDVHQILSIYEPDLGQRLFNIVAYKSRLLFDLGRIFSDSIQNLERKRLVIRELVYIDPEILRFSHRIGLTKVISEFEKEERIKFRNVNLSYPEERAMYLKRARKRLSELKVGRDNLAQLVRKHYEPHHLV